MEDAYREDLAYIHDAGFGGLAQAAAPVLLQELRRQGFERGPVVDLGCGSGILAEHMAAGGFDVLGIDLSAAFIARARQRVPNGRFRVESLLVAEMPPCIAVAAIGECLNYLFDEHYSVEGVCDVLERAFRVLEPGGLMLFDAAEPGRVPGGKAKSHGTGADWAVLVTAEEDAYRELLTRHITSFRKVGEWYRRDEEVHRLQMLPRAQVVSWLEQIGFQVQTLDGYGALSFPPGLVGYLARKPR